MKTSSIYAVQHHAQQDDTASRMLSGSRAGGEGQRAGLLSGNRVLLDRQLVHKAAASEVLLLECAAVEKDVWRFAFELPRAHAANDSALPGLTSPLLGLELVRQAGIAFSHLAMDVPLNSRFLLRSISLRWHAAVPEYPDFNPLRGALVVRLTDSRFRRSKTSGITADVAICVDDIQIGIGSGNIDFLEPRQYDAIRRGSSEAVVRHDDSPLQGLRFESQSVRGQLGVNTQDPFIFDHVSDHIPGMLLAKAATAAHTQVHPNVQCMGIHLSCERFAEWDAAVDFLTVPIEGEGALTTFFQAGVLLAEASCFSAAPTLSG